MSPKKSGMSHDLIIPSQSGNVEVVRLLCVLGTDVNTPGENGATPAFFASQSRGERPAGRAQLLAKKGASGSVLVVVVVVVVHQFGGGGGEYQFAVHFDRKEK